MATPVSGSVRRVPVVCECGAGDMVASSRVVFDRKTFTLSCSSCWAEVREELQRFPVRVNWPGEGEILLGYVWGTPED